MNLMSSNFQNFSSYLTVLEMSRLSGRLFVSIRSQIHLSISTSACARVCVCLSVSDFSLVCLSLCVCRCMYILLHFQLPSLLRQKGGKAILLQNLPVWIKSNPKRRNFFSFSFMNKVWLSRECKGKWNRIAKLEYTGNPVDSFILLYDSLCRIYRLI